MAAILNKDTIDLVIYHGKCPDGFGAALCVWIYFNEHGGKNKNNKSIEYYGATYNQSPPQVSGRNVLVCDFSYKYDIMLKMLTDANSFLIIDHHKSGMENLEKIDEKYKIFDMNHSGASLTWSYMFPERTMPLLIQYIEDNDIWLRKLPNIKEVTSYIATLPFEFVEYHKLIDSGECVDGTYIKTEVIPSAIGMNKQNETYIKQSLSSTSVKFIKIDDMYYLVAILNSTVLRSEIGNRLLDVYPNIDFSCVYNVKDGVNHISLRSTDDRTDVSLIAAKFGGGGHRNASGMSSSVSHVIPGKHLGEYHVINMLNTLYTSNFGQYHVIYLNSCDIKHHMAKYLLQVRSIDKADHKLQVGYLSKKLQNKDNFQNKDIVIPYQYYDLACVWNYDGSVDETWFTIAWVPELTLEIITSLFEHEKNFGINDKDGYLYFSRSGLFNKIES